jgi:hypothetical protein
MFPARRNIYSASHSCGEEENRRVCSKFIDAKQIMITETKNYTLQIKCQREIATVFENTYS